MFNLFLRGPRVRRILSNLETRWLKKLCKCCLVLKVLAKEPQFKTPPLGEKIISLKFGEMVKVLYDHCIEKIFRFSWFSHSLFFFPTFSLVSGHEAPKANLRLGSKCRVFKSQRIIMERIFSSASGMHL